MQARSNSSKRWIVSVVAVLFLALAVLPASALTREAKQPSETVGEAPSTDAAPQIDCNNPPSGRKVRLRAENEIVVYMRDQRGYLQYVQLDDTSSGDIARDAQAGLSSTGKGDIYWQSTTTADFDGDGKPVSVSAFRDAVNRVHAVSIPIGKGSNWDWYKELGSYQGNDVSHIDVAAGNLDGSYGDAGDEVVIAFADDKENIQMVALPGDSQDGLGAAPNYYWGRWYVTNGSNGRGDVSHVAVAVGDLDGNGYDDEIVTAFKDGNNDLQVILFKRKAGTSWLEVKDWKTWSGTARDNIIRTWWHGSCSRCLDVATGDIDGDYEDEVILGFRDKDNKIQILTLEVTSGSRFGSVLTEAYIQWDADEGYDYPWGVDPDDTQTKYVRLAAGDVDGDAKDEIVLAYSMYVDKFGIYRYYPNVVTFDYARSGVDGIQMRANWKGWQYDGEERNSVSSISVDVGEIDMDGKAEIVLALRDGGKDLQVISFDAEDSIIWRGGWQDRGYYRETVSWVGVTLADVDGDTSFANYTGDCHAFTEKQLTAVVHVPPHWPETRDNSVAAFGTSQAQWLVDAESTQTTHAGSVTLDGSVSVDIVSIGPSLTYGWEQALVQSQEEMTRTTFSVKTSSAPYVDTWDFVVYDEVAYWCYKYEESRTGGDIMVCLPHAVTSKDMPLYEWYEEPTEPLPAGAVDSWVPVGTNFALNKPASQISTAGVWGAFNASAGRAVDGSTNGVVTEGSVALTNAHTNPWWQVDLEKNQFIDAIQVWNRTDSCCTGWLTDFYVFVSDDPFPSNDLTTLINNPNVWNYHVAGQAGRPTTVPANRSGRYVRVQRNGWGRLNLAEVEVWGHSAYANQFPTDVREGDYPYYHWVKVDGVWKAVLGQLKWEADFPIWQGRAERTWSTEEYYSFAATTGEVSSENHTLNFEATVLGIGVAGSYTEGFADTKSRTLGLSTATYWEGHAGALPAGGTSYQYVPYYYVRQETSAAGVKQTFLVLDYYVPSIDATPPPDSADVAPVATVGITPTVPIVGSPTHPDPATWYTTNTATFTWMQPLTDTAVVSGTSWYLDLVADTTPGPLSLGVTNTVTFEGLPDGVWYFHVRTMGDGGDWGDPAHRAVRIDAHPPQVEVALDPPLPTGNKGWYNTPLTITVAATDTVGSGVTSVEYSTDGSTWQPYVAPLQYTTDTVTTTVWARATDAVGHVSDPVSTTFKIDMTPPSSKVGAYGVWVATVVTDTLGNQHMVLGGVITDTLSGRAGMNIQANGGDWKAADEVGVWHPFSTMPEVEVNWYYTATTEIGRGYHIFYGYAEDEAGNQEAPYEIAQVIWFPPDSPDIGASDLTVAPKVVRPGGVVTFTLAVRNNGMQEAYVAVTDTLPSGLTLVTDTLSSDVGYDQAAGVVTWTPVLLWPGEWWRTTFSARVDGALGTTTLESQVTAHAFWPNTELLSDPARQYFRDHEDTAIFTATVTVSPTLPANADVHPPQVNLAILDGPVVTQREIGLSIGADADARWMYLREWEPDPDTGEWTVVQESGWLNYSETYTWTLSVGEGVKYMGVWVADGARNVSTLDEHSLAFTNLMGTGRHLDGGQRAQYRFEMETADLAMFLLMSSGGDADLHVWFPRNGFRPNQTSDNVGMADAVGFWVHEDGLYLVEVLAIGDTNYRLLMANEEGGLDTADLAVAEDKEKPEHPLTVSDPLSAGGMIAPPTVDIEEIYLPIVFRGE